MELKDYRNEIDRIDRELAALLDERMRVSEKIARYKAGNGMKIYDPVREREHIEDIVRNSPPDMADYYKMVFSLIMRASADHQRTVLESESGSQVEV